MNNTNVKLTGPQIAQFIIESRQQGVPDEQIYNYLNDKGLLEQGIIDDVLASKETTPELKLSPSQEADKASAEKYGAWKPYDSTAGGVNFFGSNEKGAGKLAIAGDAVLTGIKEGGLKAAQNIIPSAWGMAKNIGNALSHPLDTLGAIGGVVAGAAEKIIPGKQEHEENFDSFAKALKERYGSLDNLARTATNDPFVFGSEVTALTGGLAKMAGQGAAFDNAVAKTAQTLVTKPIGKLIEGARKLGTDGLGWATGAGGESTNQAFINPSSVQAGIKGATTPEEVVANAKGGLETIRNNMRSSYRSDLAKIKELPISLTDEFQKVKQSLLKQLDDFGVKVDPNAKGGLNFDKSAIGNKAEAMADVKGVFKDVMSWDDYTPAGLDTLKRRLGDLYSETGNARSLVSTTKNEVVKVLDKVPGYSKMTSDYAQTSNLLDQLKLITPDKVETAFTKLSQALKSNNKIKLALVKELENASGSSLMGDIAGLNLQPKLASGLTGKLATGGMGVAALSNPTLLAQFFGTALVTSPWAVGKTLQALGVTNNTIKLVWGIVNKTAYNSGALSTGAVISPVLNAANRK
jgi:hypothetical protein